ncbi:MAG: SUMF1/EgtB/PvdO family nonheme iron enzyme, partial [Armatimonadota bacterium]
MHIRTVFPRARPLLLLLAASSAIGTALAQDDAGALGPDGTTIDPTTTPAYNAARVWHPKAPPADAPTRPYRCRIVSYAGKWTRHGFGNYMTWRYPSGPLAPELEPEDKFVFARDFDVDGDGETGDDYVASLPFSLTRPLSNPDWPMHTAFPERYSSRFYGGVSWCVGNSDPGDARFYREMGYNPDHSPPWYDGRAEDHPLQGEANERKADSVLRMYWAIIWKKDDFLNEGTRYRVTFDDTSRLASISTRNYWLGYDDVRMIVQDGGQLYISDNEQFDIPKDGYKPAIGRVFLCYPTRATWASYSPRAHLVRFDPAGATFERHEFTDVQAVGWYLAKDNPEGQQAHIKWYGFEADAVVHRPEQGSVNVSMLTVPASEGVPEFWMSTCEVPYARWRDVHRYGDAPFHTLEARYVYLKDGDMGSMLLGSRPHEPDEPVTNITWWDALAWCNTLSEMEGKTPCYYVDAAFTEVFRNMEFATRAIGPGYEERNLNDPTYDTVPPPSIHVRWDADGHRLPTVAEWTAAWRAGQNAGPNARRSTLGSTHAVGSTKPDKLGLYDLLGNVWELCWPYGDVFDPEAVDTYVGLGGDFNHPADPRAAERAASPYGDHPSSGSHTIGLRLVCRRPGSPRPAMGATPEEPAYSDDGVPSWTFRRDERTGARQQPERIARLPLDMVKLPGGSFLRHPQRNTITVSAFDIAKYPTTYDQWKRVLQWAEAKGYTFSKTGDMGSMYFFDFPHSPDEPVVNITWHDMVVWCNALSEIEGRTPCFYTDEACTTVYRNAYRYRPLKVAGPDLVAAAPHRYADYSHLVPQPWIFTRWDVDGYRLPTEAEFEYALRGGTQTPYFWGEDEAQKDTYTWNIANAGGRTHPVGRKEP